MSATPLPLAGLRVLAVEQYGAGPFGSLYLADLGAEVVKIENHRDGGDVGRQVGPHFFAPGDSQFFQTFNRNKRSVTLDLKEPEGKAAFLALAASADAVLDNLRGDLAGKLGLTYEDLKEANPRIVCAHLSAYGREGSRKAWPGALRIVGRRPDDRARHRVRPARRRAERARHRPRHGHRRFALRRRAA
jgi:crotonobetainyl-CoA:carnitine CoA-transferase CaiB-like acyl-CoA transferase